MSPSWVIQTNAIDKTQAETVAWAARAHGGQVFEVTVIPFSNTLTFPNGQVPEGELVVPYGSTKLTKITQHLGWKGTFVNDNYDTRVWNENRDDMLNSAAAVMKANEVITYLERFPADLPLFIRPCADLKAFSGGVADVQEIRSWMKDYQAGNHIFSEDTLVSIHHCLNIKTEWRWFVVDGQVIDGSVYRARGQRLSIHEKDPAEKARAQLMADKWLPAPCCVMDVADTDDGLKVIEFNCINCSGFYHHDIDKIVGSLCQYMRAL